MKLPLFSVVMPAAGVGARIGADIPKQYLKLNGKEIILHTIDALLSHPQINQIIVVISDTDSYLKTLIADYGNTIKVVIGGAQRVDSVLAGLSFLQALISKNNNDWVLVHDAARPCITHDEINQLLASYQQTQGAILATPCVDTLKLAEQTHSELSVISKTVDRSHIWQAQTPQFFPLNTLIEAIQNTNNRSTITDEASAIEQQGGTVTLVEGLSSNIKITRKSDLDLAAFYLQKQKGNYV